VNEKIALGEYSDACNQKTLKFFGIDCILNVNDVSHAEEEKIAHKLSIHYVHKPIESEIKGIESWKHSFVVASNTLSSLADNHKHILVHCHAGVDRSPLVVALYLAKSQHMDVTDAYLLIKKARPWIVEHYEWVS
jgi:protein-tyrosine phosphatase